MQIQVGPGNSNSGSGGSANARVTAVLTTLAAVMLIAVIFGGSGTQHTMDPIDATSTDMSWMIPGKGKSVQPLKFWTISQMLDYLRANGLAVSKLPGAEDTLHQELYQRTEATCGTIGAGARRSNPLDSLRPDQRAKLDLPSCASATGDEPCNSNKPPESLYPYIRRMRVGAKGTFAYYSNGDLERPSNHWKMAMVVFHGATRDAFSYFCSGFQALPGNNNFKPDEILVIAPDFGYRTDWLNTAGLNITGEDAADSALYWGGSLDYRSGARSSKKFPDSKTNKDPQSSFGVVDKIMELLNNTAMFPKLEMIANVGHSAGGQTVQRYALATHLQPANYAKEGEAHLRADIDVRYVVMNPSSWAYMSPERWSYTCDKETQTCTSGELKIPSAAQARYATNDAKGKFYTALSDGQGVTGDDGVPMTPEHVVNENADFWCYDEGYNKWHYGIGNDGQGAGLDDGAHAYVLATDFKRNVETYALRNMNYIVGQRDQCSPAMPWYNETGLPGADAAKQFSSACDFHHLDTRCPAMLQGPWREYRAVHYMLYLLKFYGKSVHTLLELEVSQDINLAPGMGHNGLGMITSHEASSAIFQPNPQTTIEGA